MPLLQRQTMAIKEPTEAMLIAARDWSYKKYGKPIGDDAAIGCWKAMFEAAPENTIEGQPTDEMVELARKEFWRVLAIKELTLEDAWRAALEAALEYRLQSAPVIYRTNEPPEDVRD